MCKNQISICITSTISSPLLRPFTALNVIGVFDIISHDTPHSKTFCNKTEVLFYGHVGLYFIDPVFIKSGLCGHHPGIGPISSPYSGDITIGVNYWCADWGVTKEGAPKVNIAQTGTVSFAKRTSNPHFGNSGLTDVKVCI